MEGFDYWGGTASLGTSDEFIVPDAHPTPPSTALWTMESISSRTTAVYHTRFENQLKLVMIYHKMLCCKRWCVKGWLTSSIDIFAAEAGLEAVASSDIPSKAILSIKALLTDLHIRISAYEVCCCQEIWQGLWIHADLLQNITKWDVSVVPTPVQNFCPRQGGSGQR